jgi:cell division topological specificity factor
VFAALKEKVFGIKTSKNQAKGRLHLVLVQDRTGLSGDEMGTFKADLLAVLKRYFVIDDTGLDVQYQRETSSTTLVINSPVLRKKPTVVATERKAEAAPA